MVHVSTVITSVSDNDKSSSMIQAGASDSNMVNISTAISVSKNYSSSFIIHDINIHLAAIWYVYQL